MTTIYLDEEVVNTLFIEDQKDWEAVLHPGRLDMALTEALRLGLPQDFWPEFALMYLLGV